MSTTHPRLCLDCRRFVADVEDHHGWCVWAARAERAHEHELQTSLTSQEGTALGRVPADVVAWLTRDPQNIKALRGLMERASEAEGVEYAETTKVSTTDDYTFIIWAALQAMVNDIHAPQDMLTIEQWTLAELLLSNLDRRVNASVPPSKPAKKGIATR